MIKLVFNLHLQFTLVSLYAENQNKNSHPEGGCTLFVDISCDILSIETVDDVGFSLLREVVL